MPVIETRDLTKVYRTYKKKPGLGGAVRGLFKREYEEVRAVDGISFSIDEGEIVGFLGPNGAGKTTALKMLSGLLNPTSGEASVLGFKPWLRKDAMKRQISLLMGQKNALWWDLPARESLELNRAIYGIDMGKYTELVGRLTELLDVKDKLDVMVRELSLGERMKFELISALLHSPRALFLDEPTIGLDVTSQQKVREFLREYNREHRIVTMLTSHYMEDIESLCQRVIIIDHGRIMYDGSLASIVGRFATHKIIGLTFSEPQDCDFASAGEVVEKSTNGVKLKVPRAKVTDTARDLLSSCRVLDITVTDPPIEEVIRSVFSEHAETTLNAGNGNAGKAVETAS
jgi:ABC-2 type transport system ATP-binding protein